jgi:NADH dehydrogenase FAD-containing subunit
MKRIVIVGGGFAGLSETETVLDASDNIHASAEGRERIFFLTSPLWDNLQDAGGPRKVL